MSGVRLERVDLHHKGFEELLRSAEVGGVIRGIVSDIEEMAGDGYTGDVIQGRTRLRGGVVTADADAMRDNARHNTLVKAFTAAKRD